jgi:hypothetical protein
MWRYRVVMCVCQKFAWTCSCKTSRARTAYSAFRSGHKNELASLSWSPCNPNWLVTASRDQSLRFFDLRTLSAFQVAVSEHKGVTAIAWHPFQERLLAVGHHDGCLQYWAVGLDYPQAEVPHAHDFAVSDVAWAPAGNVVATCSHDTTVKFWARSRPGDTAAQYAYHGNPGRSYPEDNMNLVPVPGTTAAAASASASAASIGSGGVAYAGGLAARSFEEQESDRYAADLVAPAGYAPGGRSADRVTVPGDSYVCKLCGQRGHWFQTCPNVAQPSHLAHRSGAGGSYGPVPEDGSSGGGAGPVRRPPGPTYVCHKCGQTGHWKESCPFSAPGSGAARSWQQQPDRLYSSGYPTFAPAEYGPAGYAYGDSAAFAGGAGSGVPTHYGASSTAPPPYGYRTEDNTGSVARYGGWDDQEPVPNKRVRW